MLRKDCQDVCSEVTIMTTEPSTSFSTGTLINGNASYPSIGVKMEDDKKLVAATLMVLETGDLTPLIKEELKYTIQSRRVAEGKGELSVDFPRPGPYKLTAEEEIRVEKRREQNRMAARRFRRKQKESATVYVKKIQSLESNNTRMRDEIRKLRREKDELSSRLEAHLSVCPGIISPGQSFPLRIGVGT